MSSRVSGWISRKPKIPEEQTSSVVNKNLCCTWQKTHCSCLYMLFNLKGLQIWSSPDGVPPSDHRPRGHRFERWRVTRRPFCLGKTVFWPPLHRANTGQADIWPPLYMLTLSTQKAFLTRKRIFKVIYCQWVGQWVTVSGVMLSHLRALWACLNESISRDGIGPRDMYRWCGLLPRETSSLYDFHPQEM